MRKLPAASREHPGRRRGRSPAERFEKRRGLAVSLALMGAPTGGMFVPPILLALIGALGFRHGVAAAMMGVVRDIAGGYGAALGVAGGLEVLAAALILLGSRSNRSRRGGVQS